MKIGKEKEEGDAEEHVDGVVVGDGEEGGVVDGETGQKSREKRGGAVGGQAEGEQGRQRGDEGSEEDESDPRGREVGLPRQPHPRGGEDGGERHPVGVRGSREAARVGEVVPEIEFGEAVAPRKLDAAAEVVVRVHIARQRLELRDGKRDGEAEEEEKEKGAARHGADNTHFFSSRLASSSQVRGGRITYQRTQYRPRNVNAGGRRKVKASDEEGTEK
ncbi:MAG: hypothetical protein PGMFKBFP_00234 [Anaerolineales bacterium]|nr:hypothetical protein [Anaerolineales bacterium]